MRRIIYSVLTLRRAICGITILLMENRRIGVAVSETGGRVTRTIRYSMAHVYDALKTTKNTRKTIVFDEL